jgi:hypothetical protein
MKLTKLKKKTTKKTAKKASKKKSTKKKKTYEHHPDHYNTSESFLIDPLDEDLKDAWYTIRSYGESLGEQKIYASGRAIMFSKKVCYFFVRPKKSYLEVVIFLNSDEPLEGFKEPKAVSKTKFSHVFKLIHADQVEGPLTDAIAQAYAQTPA